MTVVQSLLVNLETNTAKWASEMNKCADLTEGMAKRVNSAIGLVEKAFIAVKIGEVFSKAVEEAAEAEKSMAQLTQVLKSTGGVAGVTSEQVTSLTASLQKQTGVSDDALNSASALMLTFTKVGKNVFPDAIKSVNDMSAALGQDLKTSTIQLGKALNDPIKGVSALQKVGVSFTASQKETIKALVESGRTMDAQKLILKELNTEFGGAAAAARDTFGGALGALQTSINDVFEALGTGTNSGLRGAVEFLIVATDHLKDGIEELQKWFGSNTESANQFKAALGVVGDVFNFLGEEIKAVWNIQLNLAQSISEMVGYGIRGFKEMGEYIYSQLGRPLQICIDLANTFATTFVSEFSKSVAEAPKRFNEQLAKEGKDYVGQAMSPAMREFDKWIKEAQSKQKAMADAHKNFKQSIGIDNEPEADDKSAKKEADRLKREAEALGKRQEHLGSLVDGYNQHLEQMKALTAEEKEQVKYEELKQKIASMTGVGQLDKEVAFMKLEKAHNQAMIEIKRQATSEEKGKLQELLDSMKVQTAEIEGQKTGHEEIAERMKLEAELQKLIKIGGEENLAVVQQIREEKEKQIALEEGKKHDEELKSVNEILQNYRDQGTAIQAKMNGQDNYLDLLKEERKIQESIHLSEGEKGAALDTLRQQYQVNEQYNRTLKDQDKLVDQITSSDKGYYNQVMDLREAVQSGRITMFQYNEALSKVNSGTKEASKGGKEFADTVGKGLEDALFSGKKLVDVMKDLGKELIKMAAKKILIDPLKERLGLAFDQVGRNLFGAGKTAMPIPGQSPYLPTSPFGGQSPNYGGINATNPAAPGAPGLTDWGKQFLGMNPANVNLSGGSIQSGAPIYSTGPVMMNGGQVSLNQPTINNPTFPIPANTGGGGIGGGGIFGAGGLGGLLGGILGAPFKLLSGLGGLFGGGGADGGGGIGNLLGAPFKLLGSLFGGGADGAAPGGGLFGGLQSSIGSFAPLLNPFGFLGGLGKAFGATMGGDTIFKDIAPLLNPMGLFGGLGSALGGLFGGAREFGGPMDAGRAYLVGERGPELVIPGMDSAVMSNLDWRAIMQQTNGTPLYQKMGFQPTFTGEVAMLMRKAQNYLGMSEDMKQRARTTGDGYFTNEDMGRLMQLTIDDIDPQENKEIWEWTDQYNDMIATRLQYDPGATGQQKSWAADTLSNKTWAASTMGLGKNALPTGNQLGNIFTAMAHRGVIPSTYLMQKINQRDWMMDFFDKNFKGGGGWDAIFKGSGSREGMAGAGSGVFAQYTGMGPQEFSMPFQEELGTMSNTKVPQFSNPVFGPNNGISNWGPFSGISTPANVNGSFGPGSGSYPIPSNIIGYPSGGGFGGPGGLSNPVGGFADPSAAPFDPGGYPNPWAGSQEAANGGWISPKGWQPDTTYNMNSNWYGGARASGGPVEANKVYTWNENGREMLMTTRPGEVLSADKVRDRAKQSNEKTELKVVVNNYTGQPLDARIDDRGELNLFLSDVRKNLKARRPAWQ
ncbi:MAG: phage tail length tape measure family protein [Candidatus Obscuribacterales bacterium]|nr:phage tail length tape measure family protein [Candidatus Obscuribacterales bacterium]